MAMLNTLIPSEEATKIVAKFIEDIFTIKDKIRDEELARLQKENSDLRTEVDLLHKKIESARGILCNEPEKKDPVIKHDERTSWKSLRDKILAVKPDWECTTKLPYDNTHYVRYSSSIFSGCFEIMCCGSNGFLISNTCYLTNPVRICPNEDHKFTNVYVSDEDNMVKLMLDVANCP